jgi:hypothetical protein
MRGGRLLGMQVRTKGYKMTKEEAEKVAGKDFDQTLLHMLCYQTWFYR